jgi:hypothetical protein
MRKVTFGGANSLDNHIARKDDAVDWLMWSNEAAAVMTDYWKTIDTIVMGRKTYDVALRMGAGGGADAGMMTSCSQGLRRSGKRARTLSSFRKMQRCLCAG